MIVIVDYDTGNLRSVQNMLKYLGHDSAIASTPAEIESASKIILPGVGNFDFGMRSLAERDLIPALNRKVIEQKTPTLGICLGAQLITRGSEEGELPGLGWIPADTKQFDRSRLGADLRVPHMGWADTEFDPNHPLFAGIESIPRYYYVHSFHMVCDSPRNELCYAVHGYRFTSGIAHENVTGLQFHPEKSHRFGKQVLANFASHVTAYGE
jgi:glutamine amidotransferase